MRFFVVFPSDIVMDPNLKLINASVVANKVYPRSRGVLLNRFLGCNTKKLCWVFPGVHI
jgi:hypothetical protein